MSDIKLDIRVVHDVDREGVFIFREDGGALVQCGPRVTAQDSLRMRLNRIWNEININVSYWYMHEGVLNEITEERLFGALRDIKYFGLNDKNFEEL